MKNVIRILVTITVILSVMGNTAFAGDNSDRGSRAVTLWWVIFNDPDQCIGNPGGDAKCSSVDVFGQAFLESVGNGAPDPSLIAPNFDAELAVLYATGGETTVSGRIRLAASINKRAPGTNMTLPPSVDPMGFGRGLESDSAEVHLIVRDHGRANRRDLLPQITAFLDPYCSDPNLLYFAGENTCADAQFAIFSASESGTDSLYAFADPSTPLSHPQATLLRDGDMIQVVVETQVTDSN